MLANVSQGKKIVAVGGVELGGVGKAALGGRQVAVLDVLCALEIGVVGLASLLCRDFGIGIGRRDAGREGGRGCGGVLGVGGGGEGKEDGSCK